MLHKEYFDQENILLARTWSFEKLEKEIENVDQIKKEIDKNRRRLKKLCHQKIWPINNIKKCLRLKLKKNMIILGKINIL